LLLYRVGDTVMHLCPICNRRSNVLDDDDDDDNVRCDADGSKWSADNDVTW